MSWKYIIVKKYDREVPFIFPESEVHGLMLEAIRYAWAAEAQVVAHGYLSVEALEKIKAEAVAVSAGSLNLDVFDVGGFSRTLGIKSRDGDVLRINMHPYTHGVAE